jgi:hypothetical protein
MKKQMEKDEHKAECLDSVYNKKWLFLEEFVRISEQVSMV